MEQERGRKLRSDLLLRPNRGFVATLDPVMVQTEKLSIRIRSLCDGLEEGDAVQLVPFFCSSTQRVVNLKRPLIAERTLGALSSEGFDGFVFGDEISPSATVSRHFSDSIRVFLSPALDVFKSSLVATRAAHLRTVHLFSSLAAMTVGAFSNFHVPNPTGTRTEIDM